MAEFVCTLCGKCCMGMGRYVNVVGTMGSKVICRHELGEETCYATVEKPYRDDFDPDDPEPLHEGWCPFLYEEEPGSKYVCIIYATRPQFCRNFRCARMRIYDSSGAEAGIVKGRRSLQSENQDFVKLWEEKVAPIAIDDDDAWTEAVKEALEPDGYKIEVYD